MKQILFKNLITCSFILAGIVVGAAAVYFNPGIFNIQTTQGQENGFLSLDQVSEKTISFINENILQGQGTASIAEAVEENGIYRIKLNIEGDEFDTYVTKDGSLLFPQFIDLNEESAEEQGTTIGDFSISSDDVCQENSKPIVYFFGSQGCPHCVWEHPVIEEVANSFGDLISFHNNIDSEEDQDVFSRYSTGSIPTIVIGCKYYRMGSGENSGEEGEAKNLTALVCKLTQNQPSEVCDPVQDLINQIQ